MSKEDMSVELDALIAKAARLELPTEAQIDAKTDALARGEATEAQLCEQLVPGIRLDEDEIR